jgi:GTPase-activating protein that regulates ARFs (ADP-ribosylation factors), involved in ARF-mediated vesicular transport
MGVHISFVRSLDLDSFSEEDVKKLLCGGNQTCRDFFAKHGVVVVSLDTSGGGGGGGGGGRSMTPSASSTRISTNQRGNLLLQEQYNSKVARLYRETLKARVQGKTGTGTGTYHDAGYSRTRKRRSLWYYYYHIYY